jgi:transcriptional regulator with XRE-family HTH domain
MYVACTNAVNCFVHEMYGHPTVNVHHVHMAKRALDRFRGEKRHRRTFIREWRQSRRLTLEQLANRIGITHASLSRIERGRQPYSQPLLEALADALQTEPASLLIRNPTDPEGIWSVWDQTKPGERRQIVEIAKTLIRTGT